MTMPQSIKMNRIHVCVCSVHKVSYPYPVPKAGGMGMRLKCAEVQNRSVPWRSGLESSPRRVPELVPVATELAGSW